MYIVTKRNPRQGLGDAGTTPPSNNTGKVVLVIVGIAIIAAVLKPVIWG